MSDSDQQLRQRLVWNRRYRKRTRDQTFPRRHSSSSSDSEPEPAKRTCCDTPSSNFEEDSEAELRSDDQPSPASSHIEGPVSDGRGEEGEDQGIREVAEEEEEGGERQEYGDGGVFCGSDSGSEGPVSDGREGEREDQGVREIAEEEEEGGGESSEQEDNGDEDNEEEDEDEEEEGFDITDNQPLYDGAQITLKQSALSILSFVLCHKLSGACINDLLTLISLHCGQNNLCLKSSHLFKKYFSMLGKDNVTRHYYCSVCETPVPSKDSQCASCSAQENEIDIDNPDENVKTYEIRYFIEFSLTKQLQSMYLRPGFLESLQFKFNRVKKNYNNIEDIYDGQIYTELEQEGFLSNPNNISFTMYFDSVAIYKSSKFSVWPVYLSINELKYKERSKEENVIIAGLWFGKKKPNPNLFLRPVWNKMQILQNQGVQLKLPNAHFIIVKGRVVCAVGDLPAKALFMRLIQ
ncbi:Halomucin [Frankliniella fusca]|uniref:Halomucin n=1 Tax=Frankliniella fusca TaxID=407009 RepID=A0AAE1LUB7_9NEOP|nr:Halomucin [Frankliniella fusca]